MIEALAVIAVICCVFVLLQEVSDLLGAAFASRPWESQAAPGIDPPIVEPDILAICARVRAMMDKHELEVLSRPCKPGLCKYCDQPLRIRDRFYCGILDIETEYRSIPVRED